MLVSTNLHSLPINHWISRWFFFWDLINFGSNFRKSSVNPNKKSPVAQALILEVTLLVKAFISCFLLTNSEFNFVSLIGVDTTTFLIGLHFSSSVIRLAPNTEKILEPAQMEFDQYQMFCSAAGGKVKQYTSTCTADCSYYHRKGSCGDLMTRGCDCGPGKCLSGNKCIDAPI